MRFFTFAILALAACQADTFTAADAASDAASETGGGDAAADAPSQDAAPPCPSESGYYTTVFTGQGCTTMSQVGVCVSQTDCSITMSSSTGAVTLDGSGGSAFSGGPLTIDDKGGFDSATITEGGVTRTGCVGTWDAGTSTLTIVCGGNTGLQSCVATLKRAGDICPL